MRAFLDTNVPVRHLTGDPPGQASRATALLSGSHELIATDLMVAEVVYVLESFYERPRDEVATLLRSMLALPSVACPAIDLLLRALELYETVRLDFAEAYVAAAAEITRIRRVASFDRRLDRVGSIVRVEP